MKRLKSKARRLMNRYLTGIRKSLRGSTAIDPAEVERDVREHIEIALAEVRGPITAATMSALIERIGSPTQWGPAFAGCEPPDCSESTNREGWRLAYLSFGLLVLAFALPPFLWIGVVAAFVTARASVCAAARRARSTTAGQHWLRDPALLVVYVPFILAVLLWPAILVRLAADQIVFGVFATRMVPWEIWSIAERIAEIRFATFDAIQTTHHALRTGHYLVAPVGLWLICLAGVARIWPRPFAILLRPLVDEDSPSISRSLALGGVFLFACAMLQAAGKVLA